MRTPLPNRDQITKTFSVLLGRQVDLAPVPANKFTAATRGVVAPYVLDDGKLIVLGFCDLALACHAGAALGLVPPAVASDAVKAGVPTAALLDNLREVLNVLAGSLNAPGAPHVKLAGATAVTGSLPPAAAAVLARPSARVDFLVSIQGYTGGAISFYAA